MAVGDFLGGPGCFAPGFCGAPAAAPFCGCTPRGSRAAAGRVKGRPGAASTRAKRGGSSPAGHSVTGAPVPTVLLLHPPRLRGRARTGRIVGSQPRQTDTGATEPISSVQGRARSAAGAAREGGTRRGGGRIRAHRRRSRRLPLNGVLGLTGGARSHGPPLLEGLRRWGFARGGYRGGGGNYVRATRALSAAAATAAAAAAVAAQTDRPTASGGAYAAVARGTWRRRVGAPHEQGGVRHPCARASRRRRVGAWVRPAASSSASGRHHGHRGRARGSGCACMPTRRRAADPRRSAAAAASDAGRRAMRTASPPPALS